ncbi:MAG: right-handed parallel beta-helix repeat-containing protein [Acidimicrobiales bacterium]
MIAAEPTLVVNSTADAVDSNIGDGNCDTGALIGADPECTLRAAIAEANARPEIAGIEFSIGTGDPNHSAGVWTIAPTGTPFDPISSAVVIDGSSQPGYVSSPVIVVDGAGIGVGNDTFTVTGNDVTINGLAVVRAPDDGIEVTGNSASIVDNFVGLYPSLADGGNNGRGVRVGGTATGTVISGNVFGFGYGPIRVESAADAVVTDNLIGVAPDLTTALPFTNDGVSIVGSSTVRIGGTGVGEPNVITGSPGAGISTGPGYTGTLTMVGNTIRANGGLAFDLAGDGVTSNDADDVDSGANGLLNYPILRQAVGSPATILSFDLDVPAGDYRLEVYDTGAPDASGHGEASALVHTSTVTSSGSGVQTFATTFAGAEGQHLSATVTQQLAGPAYGATSEFSNTVTVRNDSLFVDDASVRRNDVIAVGGLAGPVVGVAGNAPTFDGANDRLVATATDIADTGLTAPAWVNAATFGTDPESSPSRRRRGRRSTSSWSTIPARPRVRRWRGSASGA